MAKSNDDVLKDLIHMRRHIMNYIPTTLDNSMSYYELLAKILDFMVNNIGGGFTEQDIIDIIEKWVSENDIFAPRGVVEFTTTEELLAAQDGYYTSRGSAFPDAEANYFTMVFHNQESVDSEKLADIFAIDAASATIWYLNNGGEWTSIEKFAPRGSRTFDTIAELQALKDGYYTGTGNAFPIASNPYFVQVYHTTPGLIDIFATDASTSRMYYLTSGGEWTLMFDGGSTSANWRNGGTFTGTIADLPTNGELVYYSISGDSPITGMGTDGGFIYCLGNSWLVSGINGDKRKLIKSNGSVVDLMPTINGFPIDSDTYLYNSRLFALSKPFVAGYTGVSATNWQNTILKDVVSYDSSNIPTGIIIAMPERNANDTATILTKSIIYNFSTNQTFICISIDASTFTIEEIGGTFKPQGTITASTIASVQVLSDGYYTATGNGLPNSTDNFFLEVYHSTPSNTNIVDIFATNSVNGNKYYLTSGGTWTLINGGSGGSGLPSGYYVLSDITGNTFSEKLCNFGTDTQYVNKVLLLDDGNYTIDEPVIIEHSCRIIGIDTTITCDNLTTTTYKTISFNGVLNFLNSFGMDVEISGITFELIHNTLTESTGRETFFIYHPTNNNIDSKLNITFSNCQFNGDSFSAGTGALLYNLHTSSTNDYGEITNFIFNDCKFYYIAGLGTLYCNNFKMTDCLLYGGKSTSSVGTSTTIYCILAIIEKTNWNMFLLDNYNTDSQFAFNNLITNKSLLRITDCSFSDIDEENNATKSSCFIDCTYFHKVLIENTVFDCRAYSSSRPTPIKLPVSVGTANKQFIGATIINSAITGFSGEYQKFYLSQGYSYIKLINCLGFVIEPHSLTDGKNINFNGSVYYPGEEYVRFVADNTFTSSTRNISFVNDKLILRYNFKVTTDVVNMYLPANTLYQMNIASLVGESFPVYECAYTTVFTPSDYTPVGWLYHRRNTGSLGDYVLYIPNADSNKNYIFTAFIETSFRAY